MANGIGKPVQLNLYTITIKDRTTCNASYGWRSYDFSSGAMNFFAPGQVHRWEEKIVNAGRWGWMLAFHPDFLRKYPLGAKIGRLKFFSYDVREALHISDMERGGNTGMSRRSFLKRLGIIGTTAGLSVPVWDRHPGADEDDR